MGLQAELALVALGGLAPGALPAAHPPLVSDQNLALLAVLLGLHNPGDSTFAKDLLVDNRALLLAGETFGLNNGIFGQGSDGLLGSSHAVLHLLLGDAVQDFEGHDSSWQ